MLNTLKEFIENNREEFIETPPADVWKNIEKGLKQNNNSLKSKNISTMLKYSFGASVLIIGTLAILNLKKENSNSTFNNTITGNIPTATANIKAPDPENFSAPLAVYTSTDPVKTNSQSTKANNLSDNKVLPPDTLDVTSWLSMGSALESYSIWGDYSTGKNIGVMRSTQKKIEGFGGFMLSTMPEEYNGSSGLPKKYLGKRVRFSGYLQTENVAEWAGLWLRVGKKGGNEALAFDNMRYGKKDRSIKGTTVWTKYEIVLDVPMNASNILYGVMIAGTGEIRWHTPVLEIVNESVPVTAELQSSYPGVSQKDRYRSYHPNDFWKWYTFGHKVMPDGTWQADYTE